MGGGGEGLAYVSFNLYKFLSRWKRIFQRDKNSYLQVDTNI